MAERIDVNKLIQEAKRGNLRSSLDSRSSVPINSLTPEYGKLGKYDTGLYRGMDQNDIRGKNQPNSRAMLNAIPQSLTYIVGDTISSFGYMATILDGVDNLLEDTYNEFVYLGEDIKKAGEEFAPIYVQNKNQGFHPFSTEWFAQGFPSIFSAISMMGATKVITALPKALAKGIKYALKGTAKARKIAKAKRLLMAAKEKGMDIAQLQARHSALSAMPTSIFEASVSRHIENMMEAKGTYESTYQEALAKGMSEEEARLMAGKAAKKNYQNGWWAMMTDVPQYLMLAGLKFPKIEFSKSNFLNNTKDLLAQMGSEGFEEMFQFAISEHSKKSVFDPNYSSTILGELVQNANNPEALASGFFGALGGGLFGIPGLLGKAKETRDAMESKDPIGASLRNLGRRAINPKNEIDPYTGEQAEDISYDVIKDVSEDESLDAEVRERAAETINILDRIREDAEEYNYTEQDSQREFDKRMLTSEIKRNKKKYNELLNESDEPQSLRKAWIEAQLETIAKEKGKESEEYKVYEEFVKKELEELEAQDLTEPVNLKKIQSLARSEMEKRLELRDKYGTKKKTSPKSKKSEKPKKEEVQARKKEIQTKKEEELGKYTEEQLNEKVSEDSDQTLREKIESDFNEELNKAEQEEMPKEQEVPEEGQVSKAYEQYNNRIDQVVNPNNGLSDLEVLDTLNKAKSVIGNNKELSDLEKNELLSKVESNISKLKNNQKESSNNALADFKKNYNKNTQNGTITPEQYAKLLDENPDVLDAFAAKENENLPEPLHHTRETAKKELLDTYRKVYDRNQKELENQGIVSEQGSAKKEFDVNFEYGDAVTLNTKKNGDGWIVSNVKEEKGKVKVDVVRYNKSGKVEKRSNVLADNIIPDKKNQRPGIKKQEVQQMFSELRKLISENKEKDC